MFSCWCRCCGECLLFSLCLCSKHVSQHPDAQVLRGSDGHFLPHIRTHIGKNLSYHCLCLRSINLMLLSGFTCIMMEVNILVAGQISV